MPPIAKGRDRAAVHDPIVLVPSLSTPSTDARAQVSGSSEQGDTSREARVGRTVGPGPLDEEGSGDRGVPALEYAGQLFRLPVTYDPMHIGSQSRDERYHRIEALCQDQPGSLSDGAGDPMCSEYDAPS